jgi:hypothetical protein
VTASPVQLDLLQLLQPLGEPPPRPAASPALRRQLDRWGATPVFDTYWQFAVRRQEVLCHRLAADPPPWTTDPIIARYRFTNPYRVTDRVSQTLLRDVQYNQRWSASDLVFRTLLYKIFNRQQTWTVLRDVIGKPEVATFEPSTYAQVLTEVKRAGAALYSGAYIVPNPPYGASSKHENHLLMLARMIDDGTVDELAVMEDLRALFTVLRRVPSLGPFLAFQYAVDVNYSPVTRNGEDGFVVAGPGAQDGLKKCFAALPPRAEEEVIMWVTETQEEHLARLGLSFTYLFGRRLQPVDCQNLFCEVGKYARVSHPRYAGRSGRTRIKQAFDTRGRAPLQSLFWPPKWTRCQ